MKNTFSPEIYSFSQQMSWSLEIAKQPELFTRNSPPEQNQIRILRRWNSHTPSVMDVYGGGYFLCWNKKGTIIDPGCSFIKMFHELTPYNLGNVNMIIATHDHVDHCQDLGTLLSLFRQFNKWSLENGISKSPHILDIIMSQGVAAQFTSFISHPENTPFLRYGKFIPPTQIDRVQAPPTIALKKKTLNVDKWDPHIKALCQLYNQTIESDYNYKLKALPTKHLELLGGDTSMGLRFDLFGEKSTCSIVISGDTGVDEYNGSEKADIYNRHITAKNMAEYYNGCKLLILHVGSMEKHNKGNLLREQQHLGLQGVVEILYEIEEKPKVVVLTEWGYEFGRLGLNGRTKFTKLVAQALRNHDGIKNKYFAAVDDARIENEEDIPIIPADISLRLRLPDLKVWSRLPNGEEGWIEPVQVRSKESFSDITYHST